MQTQKQEVFNRLKHLNNKKRPDSFGLQIFFSRLSPTILEQLSQIFKMCMKEECFLNWTKTGRVTSIHKDGPKSVTGNYKLIRLLPALRIFYSNF